MIEEHFKKIMEQLTDIQQITSSHIPYEIIEPIEKELLFSDKYVSQIPPGYPSDLGETEFNLRRLKSPTNATYRNHKLRLGTTTLHLKVKGEKKNLESILLMYLGGSEILDFGGPKALITRDTAYVTLHENGVVSAAYFVPPIFMVNSWYPERMESYGGLPYPNNDEDVSNTMEKLASRYGYSDRSGLGVIPELVMFAVETFKRKI